MVKMLMRLEWRGWRNVGYDKVGYGKGSSFVSFETCFSYRQLNQQATPNWIKRAYVRSFSTYTDIQK